MTMAMKPHRLLIVSRESFLRCNMHVATTHSNCMCVWFLLKIPVQIGRKVHSQPPIWGDQTTHWTKLSELS